MAGSEYDALNPGTASAGGAFSDGADVVFHMAGGVRYKIYFNLSINGGTGFFECPSGTATSEGSYGFEWDSGDCWLSWGGDGDADMTNIRFYRVE